MDVKDVFEAFDEAKAAAEQAFNASLSGNGQRFALRAGRESARVRRHVGDWYHLAVSTRDLDTEREAVLTLAALRDVERHLREAQRANLEYQQVIDDATNLVCMARQKMDITLKGLKNE